MRKRALIEDFIQTGEVKESVLKFGGEPFGLPVELWPRSRSSGEALQFICQIPFGPNLFPGVSESLAYLFMNASDDCAETWSPDAGENAVVIVPEEKLTNKLAIGDAPRLVRMAKKLFSDRLEPKVCIYTAKLKESEDPAFISENDSYTRPESEMEAYRSAIKGNKVGGTPWFLQGDELPFPEPWHLLLQLDSATVPFSINFGDAGVGYLFVDGGGTEGKFLWQCC